MLRALILGERTGPATTRRRHGPYGIGVAVAALVAVLLRIRFVFTPITSDEGGYLAIARAWANGHELYRDVWIDRPQGLIWLYRSWASLGGDSAQSVRVLAVVVGIAAVVACGSIARQLFGDVAGVLAALFVGVLAAVPDYEGFIANGELLSGAVGAASLAVALRGIIGGIRPAVLVAAGVLGGCAFSLKQSGIDGLVTAFIALAALAVADVERRRRVITGIVAMAAGFSTVMLVLVVHGVAAGWYEYWYAVVGYRMDQRSGLVNANWGRFAYTFNIALPILAPVVIGIVAAVVLGRRSSAVGRLRLLAVWMAVALVAFFSGGQFHRHYWVILVFPLGTAAGCALSLVGSAVLRTAIAAAMLLNPVSLTARGAALPRDQVGLAMSGDPRLVRDEAVADWFEANSSEGETLYALCASAGLYGNLEIDPPYPYLWLDNVTKVPGAQAALEELFLTDDRPTYVAVYQDPLRCNPSGVVATVLAQRYDRLVDVSGVPMYALRTS